MRSQRPLRLLALLSLLSACALSPTARDLLYAADVAACGALSAVPVVGGFIAGMCAGEEQLVKGALDEAVARGQAEAALAPADAGADAATTPAQPAATASPAAVALTVRAEPLPTVAPASSDTPSTVCARLAGAKPLFHRRHKRRRHVGCAPPPHHAGAQAWLDARAEP